MILFNTPIVILYTCVKHEIVQIVSITCLKALSSAHVYW